MNHYPSKCLFIPSLSLFLLVSTGALINYLVFKFPGNNYFPPHTESIALILVLIYWGFRLLVGPTARITQVIREVGYFFIVLALITYATNTAQLTPFTPIDTQILKLEQLLHINLVAIMDWAYSFPTMIRVLKIVYASIAYQIIVMPLLVIAFLRFDLIREHYFLLITTCLIGFTFYYFFPTTAPASILSSPHFSIYQKATGLKFFQIHHYIPPNTQEGGMIAMPSFHVIWAWFSTYIIRPWRIAFSLLLLINCVLTLSCVLLGWHYPLDILGSVILLILVHSLSYWCKQWQKPQSEAFGV